VDPDSDAEEETTEVFTVNCTVWGKSSPGKTTVAGASEQVAICGGSHKSAKAAL